MSDQDLSDNKFLELKKVIHETKIKQAQEKSDRIKADHLEDED